MKKILILTALSALVAGGCSDSNSSKPPTPPPVEMSDLVTVGPITGFGSVISNGVHFDTDSATVMMNGEPGTIDDLRVGMIVSIRGEVEVATGAAKASEIRFASDIEGPISSINVAGGHFAVLGQTVFVDEMTVIDDATFGSLGVGNMVRVSGQYRSQERIQATHVYRTAVAYQAGMQMQVEGEIEDLDVGNLRFRLGQQFCNYSGAMLELGGADLANGMYVEAVSTAPMAGGDMILDRVQAHDRDRDRDQLCSSDCDFELEGFVTAFVSPTEFEVDGQPVTTTTSTEYVNGTIDNIALDIKLAVDGTLDANGVLVADRLVFRLPSVVEIEADVEGLDAEISTISLLGIDVMTDEDTLFRDHSTTALPAFGFADLAVGDRLEIRAYVDDGTIIATRVERDDADDSVTLKAPVDAIDRPSVTLLSVVATSDQDTVFQNTDFQVIDADAFFTLVAVGDLVKTEGIYTGTSILAETMFLRDCQDNCL